jgi:hypothetical protein
MQIHLGYEIKTGRSIEIPLRHLAVIGRTQDSGKTTTLEALITRSKLRALAFVTKRGEGSFTSGQIILPFFQEPTEDGSQPLWQYVASLLATALKEEMRIQRSSIMQVCDFNDSKLGRWDKPKTLAEVAENIETALPKARGFDQSMFRQLREYFRIVIPQIEQLPKAAAVDLRPGLNIMYLEKLSVEMQALIITSCLNWIRTNEKHTVTIIPEGWKFMGEKRSSPVRAAAAQLIREGGVLENYLWLDSQDLTGVTTEIRKQVGVWILGVQGEINEAERTIKHLPTGYRKPKADDVQTLRRGEFYVSWGEALHKVYVQPAWLNDDSAYLVAMTGNAAPRRPNTDKGDEEMWRERAEKLQQDVRDLEEKLKVHKSQNDNLRAELKGLRDEMKQLKDAPKPGNIFHALPERPTLEPSPEPQPLTPSFEPAHIEEAEFWLNNIWPLVRAKLSHDTTLAQLLNDIPEIEILSKRKRVELDASTLRGRLAYLIANGGFDAGLKASDVASKLKSIGAQTANANLARELKGLTTMGFLTMEGNTQATTYKRVAGLKVTTRTIESD